MPGDFFQPVGQNRGVFKQVPVAVSHNRRDRAFELDDSVSQGPGGDGVLDKQEQ